MPFAFLAFRAHLTPRAPALIFPGGQATYAQLDADVNRYARGLAALGVAAASGVAAVEASTRYRTFVLLLALERLAVATTAPQDARADLRIRQAAEAGSADPARLDLGADWIAAIETSPATPFPAAARDPQAVGRVQLTSGSTGEPRRIGRSWRVLEGRAFEAAALFARNRSGPWMIRTGFDSGLGQALASAAWMTGAPVAADFPSEGLPGLIETAGGGLLGVTPLQLRELLAALPTGFRPQPRLKVLVTGGLLSPATARAARLGLTPDIDIVYGASECGRVAVGPAERLDTTPGWVGWPVPGVQVEVDAPHGESGELRIRGPWSAAGYLDDAEATSQVFRDGFVHTGDIGRLTPDGGLVLEGRADDRMNIGGVKVLPGPIEDAALAHPAIRDACAFALPGDGGLDEVWLALVSEPGVTREAMVIHLAERGIALPALRFAWTDTIPRRPTGKVDRQALRAQTEAALKT